MDFEAWLFLLSWVSAFLAGYGLACRAELIHYRKVDLEKLEVEKSSNSQPKCPFDHKDVENLKQLQNTV